MSVPQSLPGAVVADALRTELLGTSAVALANPQDIKQLFITGVDNVRVVILNADSLVLLGDFGADHQDGTHDVDFDRDGRLYVTDTITVG